MTVLRKSAYTFADLNKELNDLYEYLISEKYSQKKITKLTKPLISKIPENKNHSTLIYSALGVFLTLGIIYALTYWDTFYWNLTALTRICLIKILNIYDWKHLKDADCLIPKPSFTRSVSFDDNFAFECDLCESIMAFDDVTYDYETEDNDFIEKLINIDRPVIMKGGIEHWVQKDQHFIDILLKEDDFASSMPCKISSNIHNSRDDFVEVKNLISKTMIFDRFFLQFQNCEKAAIRIFRNVTFRPSILPDTLSPVTINWLLWSKNYNTTRFKKIDLIEKYTVVGQIKGGIMLRLLPRKNCQDICHILEVPLLENQFIVLTSLWDVEYRPFEEDENLGAILEIRG